MQKRDLSIADSVSLLTQLCELCWQKIDEFNQFCVQVENIQATYNRKFSCNDGNFVAFDDSAQYFIEIEKIHNEFASKMFANQIDEKKVYIEPFCVINVDEQIPNDGSQKTQILTEPKAPEIKQEQTPGEENFDEETAVTANADVLNTDETGAMSDIEDDMSFIDENDEDYYDEEDENMGDIDANTSSDASYNEVKKPKRKRATKTTRTKKSSVYDNSGEPTKKRAKKYRKKFSVTTVNVLDDDNRRLLSYVQMKCDVCSDDRVYDSFSEIQTHFLDTHQQNGYVICCNRKFRRIGRVLQHCIWHDNPEAFKCDTCNKCFQDNVCLRDHVTSMHIPTEERRFQCDQCSRLFAKQHLLNTHLKMQHTVKEQRPFVCTEGECSQRFVLPAYLRLHIEKVHNKSDSR